MLTSHINIAIVQHNMKIIVSRIKRWGFKQRLFEIQQRLLRVKENPLLIGDDAKDIKEALQIVEYWMNHMAGEVVKTEKKGKKPVNLFN
jgi:hypothetical protein